MPEYIVAVIYEIEAHTKPGNFTIPKEVQQALGITESDPVHLVVQDADTGEFLYEGTKNMKSGPEIYGTDIKEVVQSKQFLRITVSPIH